VCAGVPVHSSTPSRHLPWRTLRWPTLPAFGMSWRARRWISQTICHCSRYNMTVEQDGGWRDQFECRKHSTRSARYFIHFQIVQFCTEYSQLGFHYTLRTGHWCPRAGMHRRTSDSQAECQPHCSTRGCLRPFGCSMSSAIPRTGVCTFSKVVSTGVLYSKYLYWCSDF
jgi:hypothetical protein